MEPREGFFFFKDERHKMLDVDRNDAVEEGSTDDAGRTAGAM